MGIGNLSAKRWYQAILAVIIVLLVISLVCKTPEILYPNHIHGVIIGYALPEDGNVWFLTDDSYRFTATTHTANSISTGMHRIFPQANIYLYNPLQRRVMKKIAVNFDEFPKQCSLVQDKERLWLICEMPNGTEMIRIFDSTGKLLMDTDQLVTEHSELKPGIADISYKQQENILLIKTKDGREFVYFIEDDSLTPATPNVVDSQKSFWATVCDELRVEEKAGKHYNSQGLTNLFLLVNESSDDQNKSRKMLYKITGSMADFYHVRYDFSLDVGIRKITDQENLKPIRLTPEEIYLEPILVYQDSDRVIILHQDQIGDSAKRMLTCVNSTGTKWTVSPDDLFPELMVKEPYSETFFMSGKVRGKRLNNIFVLQVKGVGLMGFDINSGAKLWEIKIDE